MKPVEYQSPAEQKAREMIHKRSTKQLISDFELTELMPMSIELILTRGWLMDELEARDPVAFDRWIESDDKNYANSSPRRFFLG